MLVREKVEIGKTSETAEQNVNCLRILGLKSKFDVLSFFGQNCELHTEL